MPMPENPTTKERLLFAAMKLFGRRGFQGATVRDICREAQAANATAVNYHFGNKAGLYEAVLDLIFAENLRRRRARQEAEAGTDGPDRPPEERLRQFLATMVDVGFSGGPVARDATAIVLREMLAPSKYLDDLVERYMLPDTEEFSGIIRELLGPRATDEDVRDCLASVGGQIYYYMAFWPVFSRVYPEHPGMSEYKSELVDHVMRFSLAGLEASRRALEARH